MKIKKQNLLLLASLVWMIAGFNVLRIGIETYAEYQTVINYIVTNYRVSSLLVHGIL